MKVTMYYRFKEGDDVICETLHVPSIDKFINGLPEMIEVTTDFTGLDRIDVYEHKDGTFYRAYDDHVERWPS